MRLAVLAAALLLPATLLGQYPAVGTYKGYVQPVGTEGRFDLLMRVEKAADSTVVNVLQDPEAPPIPLTLQHLISGGFLIELGNLTCPLVVVGEEWQAVCTDPFDQPTFSLHFARKAEPPATSAPRTPG